MLAYKVLLKLSFNSTGGQFVTNVTLYVCYIYIGSDILMEPFYCLSRSTECSNAECHVRQRYNVHRLVLLTRSEQYFTYLKSVLDFQPNNGTCYPSKCPVYIYHNGRTMFSVHTISGPPIFKCPH